MSSHRREGRALGLLSAMIVIGIGLLVIPWLMTPPAYLDLALRDAAFGSDLSKQRVTITDSRTGKSMIVAIRKVAGKFVARVGRINSGRTAYTAQITGYKQATARVQAAALQSVSAPVDLMPTFGRLEISTYNAIKAAEPVAAMVRDGARAATDQPQRVVVLDLPPGKHLLSAAASGFCASEREFQVTAGQVTKASFPLSPDLKGEEIARFVLGWRNEPRDLDTHFWKTDSGRFPSPDTVYFNNKAGLLPGGTMFARLDVDERYPGAYETLTVLAPASAGQFRYFIHAYQGIGTIGEATATVQVYTRGCQVRTFTPPPNCAFRIWNVTNLRYVDGQVELEDQQRCEPEGTTAIQK